MNILDYIKKSLERKGLSLKGGDGYEDWVTVVEAHKVGLLSCYLLSFIGEKGIKSWTAFSAYSRGFPKYLSLVAHKNYGFIDVTNLNHSSNELWVIGVCDRRKVGRQYRYTLTKVFKENSEEFWCNHYLGGSTGLFGSVSGKIETPKQAGPLYKEYKLTEFTEGFGL